MPPRVGILSIQHESNTFLHKLTTLVDFEQCYILEGEAIRQKLAKTPHEIGGFFLGMLNEEIDVVPAFAAWAMPSGVIAAECADELVDRLLASIDQVGPVDGWLVAPHGAAVAANHADFDGYWLSLVRDKIGSDVPIIGTLDLHANLSPRMVAACDALIAYRTNPHLDQLERGIEAATLMASTVRKEIRPVMKAKFPPLAVNIERQATAEAHWQPLLKKAGEQRESAGALSNSLVYGFPYSDVAKMGSSVIVVTDDSPELADRLADEIADLWWRNRKEFAGEMISVSDAVDAAASEMGPTCLLDMGDNVGGGSAGDGTVLAQELIQRGIGPSLVVLFDPESVASCQNAGIGARLQLRMGGKTDDLHGSPIIQEVTVVSLHNGQFEELEVRHGGRRHYDQGPTAVVTAGPMTFILTTRRMPPLSLHQVISCGLEPQRYKVLIAKGVHAPVAAYAPVSRRLIRVNTPGTTRAEMQSLNYQHRRRPLFPLEEDTLWNAK